MIRISKEWPNFQDVMTAYKSCRIHKPASSSQIRFEFKLGQNINDLLTAIHSGKYRPKPSKCFIVTHPKPREIFAADFKDRVVHHLIIMQLEPLWNQKFIDSSFACRVGKGSHGAIRYLGKKVRSLSRGGIDPIWCLQLDIEKFFVSIDRHILCDLLLQNVYHSKLRELIQSLYEHDAREGVKKNSTPAMFHLIPKGKSWFDQESNQGLPIGNLTSQFGANVYLTAMDHFIQRSLKPEAYLRYMDDLLFLDRDPEKLKTMAEPVDQWLQIRRKQKLNPNKTKFSCLTKGIQYLGYKFRQTNFSFEPLKIFSEPQKKWKFIQSLKKLENMKASTSNRPHLLAPIVSDKKAIQEIASVNSRMGSLIHAQTFHFRKKSLRKFLENTREYKDIPEELADSWSPFLVKKGYRAISFR